MIWLSKIQIEISSCIRRVWKRNNSQSKSIHSCFGLYILNKLFQIFEISSLIFAFHQLLYWMAVWFYRLFHNPFFSLFLFPIFPLFGFSCIQFLTTSNIFLYNFLTSSKSSWLPTHTNTYNNWNETKMQNL